MTTIQQQLDVSAKNSQFSSNISKLKNSQGSEDREKIKKLSEDFESIFLQLMLKSMRDTVPKNGLLDGGNGEDVFRSMLDQEYSKSMAGQRFSGIADSIEKSLLQHLGDAVSTNGKIGAAKAYQK